MRVRDVTERADSFTHSTLFRTKVSTRKQALPRHETYLSTRVSDTEAVTVSTLGG